MKRVIIGVLAVTFVVSPFGAAVAKEEKKRSRPQTLGDLFAANDSGKEGQQEPKQEGPQDETMPDEETGKGPAPNSGDCESDGSGF